MFVSEVFQVGDIYVGVVKIFHLLKSTRLNPKIMALQMKTEKCGASINDVKSF